MAALLEPHVVLEMDDVQLVVRTSGPEVGRTVVAEEGAPVRVVTRVSPRGVDDALAAAVAG